MQTVTGCCWMISQSLFSFLDLSLIGSKKKKRLLLVECQWTLLSCIPPLSLGDKQKQRIFSTVERSGNLLVPRILWWYNAEFCDHWRKSSKVLCPVLFIGKKMLGMLRKPLLGLKGTMYEKSWRYYKITEKMPLVPTVNLFMN